MSNVVHLNVPSQKQREAERHTALLRSFAQHRRFGDDVFWLKENAELLNILECTNVQLGPEALSTHEDFYAQVEKRLGFFPQYYRFLLSICLDLVDLGMDGNKGEDLVAWVVKQGMAEAELSDLQRGEARRLMLRRGFDPLPWDEGLADRLRQFVSRAATFAMPNKKAAYELTHTIFYLSEYGRKDPLLGGEARQSLDFAGTLAFLDQNADLLAEICVAMRYAGFSPPEIWESWLVRHSHRFSVHSGPAVSTQDDYHEFFVCNWFLASAGQTPFTKRFEPERMAFIRPETVTGPLREMSECMFGLDDLRCDDWGQMRPVVSETLSEDAHHILSQAEEASSCFEAFFSGFARVDLREAVL
jgi:hypothetical protein